MPRFRHILFIVTALAAGACTPESIRSLPENLAVPADDRLVGTWRAKVLGNDHLAVVTRGRRDVLDVVLRSQTDPAGDTPPRETRHQLHFYNVNGTPVIVEHGPGVLPGRDVFRFATYDVGDDGSVTMHYAAQQEFAKFIMPLRLAAQIRARGPVFYDFLITAYPENIAGVLRRVPPAQMFSVSFGPFTRQ